MGLQSLGIVSMKDEKIIREMLGLSSGQNKMSTNKLVTVKRKMTEVLSKVDMIQFLERYRWEDLPPGLDHDLVERILYFRGRGVFFVLDDKYFFLPFGLDGTIDTYGRYLRVKPLSFNGTAEIGDHFLPDFTLSIIRDINTEEDKNKDAVILYDTSIMLSQYNLPAFYQQMFMISEQADVAVLIKKNLINSTVLYTIVAQNDNQKTKIQQELMNWSDENLFKYVTVVTSATKLDTLKESSKLDTQNLFGAWTSYDNLRKTLIGLKNTGLFQKTAHTLDQEVEQASDETDAVFENGLRMRKKFCKVINERFGLNVKVFANINEQDDGTNIRDSEKLDDRENHHKKE